jgi:hypothetical protein
MSQRAKEDFEKSSSNGTLQYKKIIKKLNNSIVKEKESKYETKFSNYSNNNDLQSPLVHKIYYQNETDLSPVKNKNVFKSKILIKLKRRKSFLLKEFKCN